MPFKTVFRALTVLLICKSFALAQSSSGQDKSQAKLFGEFSLGSDLRDKGVTQTDSAPFFLGSMGYAFPKAKLGISANNVKFPDSDESLNLKVFAQYKFEMFNQVHFTPRFDFNNYYRSSSRNGTIVSVDLDIYSWHVYYEKLDKFEGTETTQDWIGVGKRFSFSSNWGLDSRIGYATYDTDVFDSAFDIKLALDYQFKDFKPSLEATYHSAPDDFGGRADLAGYFKVSAKF